MKIGLRIPGTARQLPFETFCQWCRDTGFQSVDLGTVTPEAVATAARYNLEIGTADLPGTRDLLSPDPARQEQGVAGVIEQDAVKRPAQRDYVFQVKHQRFHPADEDILFITGTDGEIFITADGLFTAQEEPFPVGHLMVADGLDELILNMKAQNMVRKQGLIAGKFQPRSVKVNISFWTMSVASPSPRKKSSVRSKIGVRTSRYP